MAEEKFARGIELLRRPVMPLVAIVEFLFMTGEFTLAEIIEQLPEPIETDRTVYAAPREQLRSYLDSLAGLEKSKCKAARNPGVVDEHGTLLDPLTAATVLVRQQVLSEELERINSLLCGPCNCILCCSGPDLGMTQEHFEIPLGPDEPEQFPVERIDSDLSRSHRAADEKELPVNGRPFYRRETPVLIHWQNGWSLILPKTTNCPRLSENGQCTIYRQRPEVCRRPQIFPYLIEPFADPDRPAVAYRLRQTLLAISDCPYVQELQEEIADYAAASELLLAVKRNKA